MTNSRKLLHTCISTPLHQVSSVPNQSDHVVRDHLHIPNFWSNQHSDKQIIIKKLTGRKLLTAIIRTQCILKVSRPVFHKQRALSLGNRRNHLLRTFKHANEETELIFAHFRLGRIHFCKACVWPKKRRTNKHKILTYLENRPQERTKWLNLHDSDYSISRSRGYDKDFKFENVYRTQREFESSMFESKLGKMLNVCKHWWRQISLCDWYILQICLASTFETNTR